MSVVTCGRPDCATPLTARQLGQGTRFCSRWCHAQTRRLRAASTVTACRRCGKSLSTVQRQRRNGHCSIRCSMRTRHGRPAHTRTRCADCNSPLTRQQIWRRRSWCSKACTKRAEWARRPELKARAVAASQAIQRRRYIVRLRAFLATATPDLAGAKGWRNGWAVATRRARVRGIDSPRPPYGSSVALRRAIVAAAPSVAEAYRRCYAAAYTRAWALVREGRCAAA